MKGGVAIEAYFQGEIRLSHYIQAQLLHLTIARWFSGGVIAILLALTGIYVAIGPFDLKNVLPVLLFFLIVSATPHWFPYLQALLQGRRILPTLRSLAGRAYSDGLFLTTGFSKPTFLWNEYIHFRASSKLVLLYLSAGGIQIFPSEFFEDDDIWRDFRGLVQKHVKRVT